MTITETYGIMLCAKNRFIGCVYLFGVYRQFLTQTENKTVRKQRKICSHTVKIAEYTEYLQPKVYIYRSRVAWGGRGRKFKSCHSDQEIRENEQFSRIFSFVFVQDRKSVV